SAPIPRSAVAKSRSHGRRGTRPCTWSRGRDAGRGGAARVCTGPRRSAGDRSRISRRRRHARAKASRGRSSGRGYAGGQDDVGGVGDGEPLGAVPYDGVTTTATGAPWILCDSRTWSWGK